MSAGSKPAAKLRTAGSLVLAAFQEWVRDRCEGLAAAIAFNALLVVASFCTAILVLAARLFGEAWMRQHILPAVLAWVGPRGEAVLWTLLVHTEHVDPATLLSFSIVGTLGLIYGASGFFLQVQDSLETVWNVRREIARIPVQLRKRLYGLLYAAASAIIVLAGFLAAGVVFSSGPGRPDQPLRDAVRLTGEALIAFLTFWALATFLLWVLPPVRLTLRQILPWTALIAALHLLGRLVLTWFAATQTSAAEVDIGEAMILTILWIHYAGMIFLYVAQLMKVYLQRYSGVILPHGPNDAAPPAEHR